MRELIGEEMRWEWEVRRATESIPAPAFQNWEVEQELKVLADRGSSGDEVKMQQM